MNTKNKHFKGSGWSLSVIEFLEISVASYQTFKGGSSFIPLPPIIKNRGGTVNIINNSDNFCILYACLCHKYGYKLERHNINNPDAYKEYFQEFNLEGVFFPPSKDDLEKLEIKNPTFSFLIFCLEDDNTISCPIYKSKHIKENHVKLLLIMNADYSKSHYVYIRSLSRLLFGQKKSRTTIFCEDCLSVFTTISNLVQHVEIGCSGLRIKFPKDNFLSFKNYNAFQRNKFAFYADLEMLLMPVDTAAPNPNRSYSQTMNRLEPFIAAYMIKSPIEDEYFNNIKTFSGVGCMEKFILSLETSAKYVYDKYLCKNYPISLTNQDLDYIAKQTHCFSCQRVLAECGGGVRDHDHHLEKNNFRHILCGRCNLNLKSGYLVVCMHNLNFDSHPILLELGRQNRKVTAISLNHETSISFSTFFKMKDGKNLEMRFICTYRHLSESLATLAKDVEHFPEFKKLQRSYKMEKTEIAKQVYCYNYMSSFETLKECQLPSIENFFNVLTNKGITEEEYAYANDFFDKLEDKTLLGFSIAYCEFDVAVLCDIFEEYRTNSIALTKLDPVYFYTCASLSFGSYLSGVEGGKIHLVTDNNLYNLCRKSIRGGLCSANVKYTEANNKFVPNYDPSKPECWILDLDVNGLYSFSMTFKLPYSNYKLLENDSEEFKELEKIILDKKIFSEKYNEESDFGLLVEFDCEIDAAYHNYLNELPPLCEEMVIGKVKKLVANLNNKTQYLAHYLNVQMAQKLNVKITKIHKIVTFYQNKVTSKYVNMLNIERQRQQSVASQKFVKTKINMLYGEAF